MDIVIMFEWNQAPKIYVWSSCISTHTGSHRLIWKESRLISTYRTLYNTPVFAYSDTINALNYSLHDQFFNLCVLKFLLS